MIGNPSIETIDFLYSNSYIFILFIVMLMAIAIFVAAIIYFSNKHNKGSTYVVFVGICALTLILILWMAKFDSYNRKLMHAANSHHDLFIENTKKQIAILDEKIAANPDVTNAVIRDKINEIKQARDYLAQYVDKKVSFVPPRGSPESKNRPLSQSLNAIVIEVRGG